MFSYISEDLIKDESVTRIGFFTSVFVVIVLLERFFPRCQLSRPRLFGWIRKLNKMNKT
jgi:hypothetical protein